MVVYGALLSTGCTPQGEDCSPGATESQGPAGEQGPVGKASQSAKIGIKLHLLKCAVVNLGGAAEIVQYNAATQVAYATDSTDNKVAMIGVSDISSVPLALPSNDNSLHLHD